MSNLRCRPRLLMIGNPRYGISVVKGAYYDDVYSLKSPDSCGYFIANAIARIPERRRLIYIVTARRIKK